MYRADKRAQAASCVAHAEAAGKKTRHTTAQRASSADQVIHYHNLFKLVSSSLEQPADTVMPQLKGKREDCKVRRAEIASAKTSACTQMCDLIMSHQHLISLPSLDGNNRPTVPARFHQPINRPFRCLTSENAPLDAPDGCSPCLITDIRICG